MSATSALLRVAWWVAAMDTGEAGFGLGVLFHDCECPN